jgi:hypothetical protein
MIAQLLDSAFMLEQLQVVKDSLGAEAARVRGGDAEAIARADNAGLDPEALDEAREAVEESHERQRAQAEAEEANTLAGGDKNRPIFLPSDPVSSLVQSMLGEFYEDKGMVVEPTGEGLLASDVPITNLSLRGVAPAGGSAASLFQRFSRTDVGWASCKLAEGIRLFRGRRRFPNVAAPPVKIGNRARLILVSDWGTGVPRAQQIGTAMRALLTASGANDAEQHVIHLGDVYYSGWAREYDKHFLRYWPVKPGEEARIGSWCLNANHDMYSGGHAYFDHLLKKLAFGRQAQSSFFSLENDYWQFLGLDTGYTEYDLHGDQGAWACRLREAAPGKKGVLFTHHQPFSAYDRGSPEMEKKLAPALTKDLIKAWFWGHEHRCTLYKPRPHLDFGRCIGHGGVPEYATSKTLPDSVQWEYREYLQSGFERFARFGFVVLELHDDTMTVEYRGEDGGPHRTETIR